ncbi:MAG: vWA domain-containing protein, partial [Pseudobdellovibrio sp.]
MNKKLIAFLMSLNLTACSFLAPQTPPQEATHSTEVKPSDKGEGADLKASEKRDGLYDAYELKKVKLEQQKDEEATPAPATPSSAGLYNQARGFGASMAMAEKAKAGTGGGAVKMFSSARVMAPPVYQTQETFDKINENTFHQCLTEPLSTFSADVDTASYSNMRRMITQGTVPPADAIRVEELINYFNYNYEAPSKGAFAVNMEVAPALWNKKHRVVRIGIKGKEMKVDERPASNLVFLIDVSGSMDSPERLPLVKSTLAMLVDKLGSNDKISIVVYAGAAGLVLKPTTGDNKIQILRALDNLKAGGSTNGGGGIELAYKIATENFIKGGVNRVILTTDGDFNVGTTSREALVSLVEKNGKKNIYLSILGFGMGNYRDGLMETLSNKGNGNYAYIDTQAEARKVMVEQLSGTLVTIAKDVKLQVEFNPKFVDSYRLVGYEDRVLKNEDFNNDKKDAGDIGAGHTVTALYEIVPAGESVGDSKVDALKYQKNEGKMIPVAKADNDSNEILTVKIRYKKPDGDVSTKEEFPLTQQNTSFEDASESFRFSSAVALFGMLLRKSDYVQDG